MKGTVVESLPAEFTASNDYHHRIVHKRKRSIRPRPSSPFTTVTATTTTSSSSATEFHGGESIGLTTVMNTTSGSIPSPVVSYDGSTVTEEEEDMANCLILLAQSSEYISVSEKVKSNRKANAVEKSPMTVMICEGERGYVYECKTCNRKFNSFQALGGHRASHKKPKPITIDHHHREPQLESYDENLINDHHSHHEKLKLNQIVEAAAASVRLPASVTNNHRNKLPLVSTKVHECSICGAEFSSGQALGGHMRRHRALLAAGPLRPISSSIVAAGEKCDADEGRKILPLDLNLPAPDDNDHRGDTKFQFMFTSSALVDCHF